MEIEKVVYEQVVWEPDAHFLFIFIFCIHFTFHKLSSQNMRII